MQHTPLAAFVVRDPETLGLRPDGSDIDDTTSPRAQDDTGWTLREAVGTAAFWRLAGVMMLSILTIPAVYVHLSQYARDLQIQAPRARFIMLVGLWSLIGNVLLAWYADRLGRSRSLGLALVLGVLALGGFAAARGLPALTAASIGFGLYYGTFASLFPAVMSDVFGRRYAGTLTGFSFALGSLTSAIGPVLMGFVADQTGHYRLAFLGGSLPTLRLAHPIENKEIRVGIDPRRIPRKMLEKSVTQQEAPDAWIFSVSRPYLNCQNSV